MSITYPLDFLDTWPGVASMQLMFRQELAPERGGSGNSADLGPALWELTAQSRELKPSEYRDLLAVITSLENGAKLFKGYDRTSCFPLAYPNGGSSAATGLIFDVDTSTYRSLRLTGLSANQIISRGDFMSWNYDSGYIALHQAMETITANGSGLTTMIEVRPHIRESTDFDASPTPTVRLRKPHANMHIVPGSVQASGIGLNGRGTISFVGRQTISPP